MVRRYAFFMINPERTEKRRVPDRSMAMIDMSAWNIDYLPVTKKAIREKGVWDEHTRYDGKPFGNWP